MTLTSFEERYVPEPMSGCFLFTGSLGNSGYGLLWKDGKTQSAHRVAWLLAFGPVPDGLCVLHKCDNKVCVNPDHLFLGTQQDNVRDRDAKGRQAAGERHWSKTNPEKVPRGEHSGKSKLTIDDVRGIRAKHAAGELQRLIAEEFGVCRFTVMRIIHRKLWGHIS